MELLRKAGQVLLGAALAYAGVGHLTSNRIEFQAQVPTFLQAQADFVVLASGVVEIVLGVGDLVYRSLAQLSITRSWRLTL